MPSVTLVVKRMSWIHSHRLSKEKLVKAKHSVWRMDCEAGLIDM
jgi:hypothetical protein